VTPVDACRSGIVPGRMGLRTRLDWSGRGSLTRSTDDRVTETARRPGAVSIPCSNPRSPSRAPRVHANGILGIKRIKGMPEIKRTATPFEHRMQPHPLTCGYSNSRLPVSLFESPLFETGSTDGLRETPDAGQGVGRIELLTWGTRRQVRLESTHGRFLGVSEAKWMLRCSRSSRMRPDFPKGCPACLVGAGG
jgi:hypothetical protein